MSTVSDYFGSLVFDDRVMRSTLSSEVYESLRKTIDEGSELDIGVFSNSEQAFVSQAGMYADVMKILISHADQVEAVQVWGLTDQMSWRSREYPLLFDGNGNPKPAFWAVADPDSVQ